MSLKAFLTVVISILSFQYAFGQLDPWWKLDYNYSVDTIEIRREKISDSVVNYAKSFMGVPYVWGGSEPSSGFDCSGFICYVFKEYGIDLPRTSTEQFNAGVPIPYTDAQPGDLILFAGTETEGGSPGHVGIVLSYDPETGFSFIHTSSLASGGVRISNEADEAYYYKRFLEIRRVIK